MQRQRTKLKLVGSMEMARATSQVHKKYPHKPSGRLLTRTEKILKIGIPCILLVIGGILAVIFLTAVRNNGVEPLISSPNNVIIKKMMYPEEYNNIVVPEATKNYLEPELVYAVIKVESKFDPEAESQVGALGLMQMTPSTFEWVQTMVPSDEIYIKEDLKKPEISIRYGCKYLAWNIERFGSVETALCAYNAGPGIVEKWLADSTYSADGKTLDYIPYPATKAYVKNVMEAYETYKKLYTGHESEVSSQG